MVAPCGDLQNRSSVPLLQQGQYHRGREMEPVDSVEIQDIAAGGPNLRKGQGEILLQSHPP